MKKKEFQALGDLEAKIMEVVWDLKKATVRDVLNKIKATKKPAYTTIMTVMGRLHDKKILKREFKNDAYLYAPVQDREGFFASTSKKIINSIINEFGEEVAVASFIDAMELSSPKKNKELKKKLEKIIR